MVITSRSVRLAVNLCVIGALLVPNPAMRTATASACDSGIASTQKCEGCGRCSIASDGDRCGCCQQQPARIAKPAQTCCSGKSHCGSSPAASSNVRDSTVAEVCSCNCGRTPEPTAPAPPTRSAAEKLTELLMAPTAIHVSHSHDEQHCSPRELEIVPLTLLPLDTQRQLCVWCI